MERTTSLLKLLLMGWWGASVQAAFTQDEAETVLSTLRYLRVGECILAPEMIDGTVSGVVRKFGGASISTGVVRVESLGGFLRRWRPPGTPTAVVIKVRTTSAVKDLLEENSQLLRRFIWFLIAEDDLNPEIRIPFDCQFFQIQKGASRTFRLTEVYHLKNSSAYRSEFGVWTPGVGLNASSPNINRRRTDLKGIDLEITTCNEHSEDDPIKAFWRDSAPILNYSLKMESQGRRTGDQEMDPHQDGTACLWGITKLDVGQDWIFSSFGERVRLLTKFRGTDEIGWRAYVRPFTGEMWGALGIWLLLSTAAGVLVDGPSVKSLYLNAFTALFRLCNSDPTGHRPGESLPLSAKLAHLATFAVPAAVVPAYSAYILSTLSFVTPVEPFNDLKGFIADGTYRLAVVEGSFAERYLRRSKDPELRRIHEHLFVKKLSPTFRALFEELCDDPKLAGLFVDSKTFRSLFPCRMFVIKREIIFISTGVLLPKGSPLRKILNERWAEYQERGMKRRPPRVYDPTKPSGRGKEQIGGDPLKISQMAAIFFLVPLGVFMSLLVLSIEVTVRNVLKASKTKTSDGRRF